MRSIKQTLLFGLILWLVPFFIAFLIYPLKLAQSPLFETIMPLTLTLCVVSLSSLYLKGLESGFLPESIKLGIIWLAISLVIDLFMFMWGPMQMSLGAYLQDIGLTYLIFPFVTIGMGYSLEQLQARSASGR